MEKNEDRKSRNWFLKFMVVTYSTCIVMGLFLTLAKYFGLGYEDISYGTCLSPIWVPPALTITCTGFFLVIIAIKEWDKW